MIINDIFKQFTSFFFLTIEGDMGFSRTLFQGVDYESFMCSKCEDVAIDPVIKSCCERLLCKKCFFNDSCSNESCGGGAIPRQLTANENKKYIMLKMKCYECNYDLTIGTLGTHYEVCIKKKYDELVHLFKDLVAWYRATNRRNDDLVLENVQLKHVCSQLRNRFFEELREQQAHGNRSLPSTCQDGVNFKLIVLLSPPIFTLDSESGNVPNDMVETLKQLINDECAKGVKIPLKQFFEPIKRGMNSKFKGNWQNYDGLVYDPIRARCTREREIHYTLQWDVTSLGKKTRHVAFDLGSHV